MTTDNPNQDEAATSYLDWPARAKLAVAGLLVIALGLRILGMRSDFWFDEVWSARYAIESASAVALYAKALDNNHVLNSLAIHWIGPIGGFLPYRALAFSTGLIALGLAVFATRPRSPAAAIVRAILIGGSPLLVLLSSEARGYAPALAACLTGLWALRRALDDQDPRATALFNVVLPLGLASHLVFLHFYVASFIYALYALIAQQRSARDRAGPAATARRLAALFLLPTAAAIAHWFFFVSKMESGGGPQYAPSEFASRLVAFTFGLPEWPLLLAAFSVLGCGAFVFEIARRKKSQDPEWVFLVVIIFLSPAFFLAVFPPSVMAVRYFSIQILFFLIASAGPIAAALERGGVARIAAFCALLVIGTSNAVYQLDFAKDGRGHYLEAMRAIAESEATGRSITIGGDHDSRVRLLVEFYSLFIGRDIAYVRQEEIPARPPGWFIRHATRQTRDPADERIAVHGHHYRHIARYPFAYLSGFTWDVYRLDAGSDLRQ